MFSIIRMINYKQDKVEAYKNQIYFYLSFSVQRYICIYIALYLELNDDDDNANDNDKDDL